MKTLSQLTALSCALAATAALSGDLNAAVDTTSYSGAQCAMWSDLFTVSWQREGNRGYNNHSASVLVSCPVAKSQTGSGGLTFAAIYVNNPAGKTTTCSLRSTDVNGTGTLVSTGSRTGSGWGAIYLSRPNAPAWGSYTLQCTIPNGGSIYSYYTEEQI